MFLVRFVVALGIYKVCLIMKPLLWDEDEVISERELG